MIGRGSPRILQLAGREADIVSINYNNAGGKLGPAGTVASGPSATLDKLRWIREGAGDRFDQIEIETSAMFLTVSDSPEPYLEETLDRLGVSREEVLGDPHVLIGTLEECCDLLRERCERYGISYITVSHRNMEQFAPIVAVLSGR